MKASILTLAIALTALLGLGNSASAATPGKEAVTTLNQSSPINKIEVHGNVELYLSTGPTDQVKVYNDYYTENAMIQGHDGVLRIASYKDQKLVVWVTANSLQGLSVYDDATVKSFGRLSTLALDVKLYNNASAQLDMDAYEITMKQSDRAKTDLSGLVCNANLSCEYSSSLNIAGLDAEHVVKKVIPANTGSYQDLAASL